MIISSMNALIEALRAEEPIQKVWISRSHRDPRVQELKALCRQYGVLYRFVPREALERKAGSSNQGVFAEIAEVRTYSLETALEKAPGQFFLVLDGVTDTGNMGAILRSAAAAEVDAVILPRRRSAPLNESVMTASAGGLLVTRMVISRSLTEDLKILKKAGYWVFGADMAARSEYTEIQGNGPVVLVLGSEAHGISPAVMRQVDQMVRIPISKSVESLNVSVAAAVLMFEVVRQRRSAGPDSPVPGPSHQGNEP